MWHILCATMCIVEGWQQYKSARTAAVQFKQSNIRFVSLWQFVCQCLCKFNANNRKWFCCTLFVAPCRFNFGILFFFTYIVKRCILSVCLYLSILLSFPYSTFWKKEGCFCWRKSLPVFANVCSFCRFTFQRALPFAWCKRWAKLFDSIARFRMVMTSATF